MKLMKNVTAALTCIVLINVFFVGCKKDPEILPLATLNDYYPFEVGKAYVYRLDSTVATAGGVALVVHSYHALDSIESSFTDNDGRMSYRIFRYTRDTLDAQGWQFAFTYFATLANDHIEYVDNNLRFIKLHLPFSEGYAFKAHSFIDVADPFSYLADWEYTYKDVGKPYVSHYGNYDTTVTVLQRDESTPDGPFDPDNYYQRNYGVEVYARGVGLIFKDFLHYTWQPDQSTAQPDDGVYENDETRDLSYGIRLQLISHH